jgi:RNase P subunit RPR2
MRESGAALVNYTDGGQGNLGAKIPESVRAKISAAKKAYFSNPENREKAKLVVKRREVIELADGNKGYQCTKCDTVKVFSEFSVRITKAGTQAHASQCKECLNSNPNKKDYYLNRRAKALNVPAEKLATLTRKERLAITVETPVKDNRPKPFHCLDAEGNVVHTFRTLKEAAEAKFYNRDIQKAIKEGTTYKGYKWAYTGERQEYQNKKQVVDGKQECTKCKEWKELENFPPSKAGTTGYGSWCKPCLRKHGW